MSGSIYDIQIETLDGQSKTLADYEGKVMLVVNTASKCGYTPQYAGLEKLHEELGEQGLAVLGFPCNQFGGQEPGSETEIGAFCERNYGVSFQMHSKIDVNGGDAHPLYKHLKREKKGVLGTAAIKWNFTKFLVNKRGDVVSRYGSKTKPKDLKKEIEGLLVR